MTRKRKPHPLIMAALTEINPELTKVMFMSADEYSDLVRQEESERRIDAWPDPDPIWEEIECYIDGAPVDDADEFYDRSTEMLTKLALYAVRIIDVFADDPALMREMATTFRKIMREALAQRTSRQ